MDEEGQTEDAVQRNGKEDDGGEGNATFAWLYLIKEVSDLTKEPWEKVWEKCIVEFFNLVSFSRYLHNREQAMINNYRNRKSY